MESILWLLLALTWLLPSSHRGSIVVLEDALEDGSYGSYCWPVANNSGMIPRKQPCLSQMLHAITHMFGIGAYFEVMYSTCPANLTQDMIKFSVLRK